MSHEETLAVLRRCDIFSRVDLIGMERILGICHTIHPEKGKVLFRQGDACQYMYVVATGMARVFQLAPNGKEHTLHLATRGQSFAEIAAMDLRPYPASAQAMEDSAFIAVDAQRFSHLLQADHQLCYQMTLSMARWMRRTIGLLEDVVLRDALGRVANYLLTHADMATLVVEMPIKHTHLANHLNLTPETLSRTLKKLSEEDAIQVGGRTITILDAELLDGLRERA